MKAIREEVQNQIFIQARTHRAWLNQPVSDDLLHQIYDLLKWAPTSANGSPARILFIKSKEQKAQLLTCMDPGNIEKTSQAPINAIIAQDMEFYEKLPKLRPDVDAKSWFLGNQALIEETAFRNSSLQGGYFIIAARSLGLDVGPMSGFDATKLNATFFAGTTWRANFICNLGYADASKLFPRSPRLNFDEACKII